MGFPGPVNCWGIGTFAALAVARRAFQHDQQLQHSVGLMATLK